MSKRHIAFFLPNLHGGGAEKVSINLLRGMVDQEDLTLDLVLGIAEGSFVGQVPEKVNIIDLKSPKVTGAFIPLIKYLRKNKPDALLSHLSHANVIAILAKKIAGVKTNLAVVEHITFSSAEEDSLVAKIISVFMKQLYPSANSIIGVSQGVSTDLEIKLGLPQGRVQTIYNPVINADLLKKATAEANHPWLQSQDIPVFLAVGRLSLQKDFANLIQAFAQVRAKKAARLIILGEGELRTELEQLVEQLGVSEDVDLPGFVDNPYSFMRQAHCFVLSSLFEGLPTVLIEAMACGCSVVSTDCPSGPQEILVGGEYGALVPIQDSQSLSQAMLNAIDSPIDKNHLKQRASLFAPKEIVPQYLEVLQSL